MQDQSQSKTSGSRQRRFEVIKAKANAVDGVDVGSGERKFGASGGMVITDPGEAHAIDQKYGMGGTRDVLVMGVDDVPKETGHTYQFGFRGVPWAKYDELGRRLPDEIDEQTDSGGYDGQEKASVERRADVPPGQEVQEKEGKGQED